jgi:hypothetical protein
LPIKNIKIKGKINQSRKIKGRARQKAKTTASPKDKSNSLINIPTSLVIILTTKTNKYSFIEKTFGYGSDILFQGSNKFFNDNLSEKKATKKTKKLYQILAIDFKALP